LLQNLYRERRIFKFFGSYRGSWFVFLIETLRRVLKINLKRFGLDFIFFLNFFRKSRYGRFGVVCSDWSWLYWLRKLRKIEWSLKIVEISLVLKIFTHRYFFLFLWNNKKKNMYLLNMYRKISDYLYYSY